MAAQLDQYNEDKATITPILKEVKEYYQQMNTFEYHWVVRLIQKLLDQGEKLMAQTELNGAEWVHYLSLYYSLKLPQLTSTTCTHLSRWISESLSYLETSLSQNLFR